MMRSCQLHRQLCFFGRATTIPSRCGTLVRQMHTLQHRSAPNIYRHAEEDRLLLRQLNSTDLIRPTVLASGLFWERHRKGGYQTGQRLSVKEHIVNGLKELKTELALFHQEWKERIESDPLVVFRPGEIDMVFGFETDKDLDRWVVTTDRDHNEGYSTASLERSPAGHGLFHGTLESRVPKDGRIKRAGYANIKSLRVRSFKRDAFYDWSQYNTLVLKVRGDGRSYLINLAAEGYYDILWNDIYHYVLYTRGGPHWQIAKIPFSKFFLASKGRVQDQQGPVPLNRITNVGFSVGSRGGHEGSFRLEFDYIGLEFDPSHQEEFAYEMYRQPKYIVAT
ncbi:complex I intermediate-associated protein 30, mitochondrial isoform X2 [Anopheles ziemanni]|uniref:complex I intermediate-associated protein 30, mitochondrial isoform X2 n=1 Tax=Anopheles coustani TaxID=139045 RepID=UPI00265B5E09|nr:complex I intermediate-associated protein 30, mitochondrial isoform X2 [Anopheles coustani]XP_058176033.1 complex I intermediate-associated protein 30, mitochondrial isoform X2 [Anopheles ziemanni]